MMSAQSRVSVGRIFQDGDCHTPSFKVPSRNLDHRRMTTISSYLFRLPYNVLAAVLEIAEYFVRVTILRVPVSYPGNPIKTPLTRRGKWANKLSLLRGNWKFASDAESHTITDKQYPNYKLTGESAGRQIWYRDDNDLDLNHTDSDYDFDAGRNSNSGDKVLRKIMISNWKGPKPDESTFPKDATEAAAKAIEFYQMLQCEDGHWAGDYGGPMFLMPGLICTLYLTGSFEKSFERYKMDAMIDFLKNHQQVDGGWGTHIECASTMFGTVLSYVSLRLLGVSPHETFMVLARKFIHDNGGALYTPSWAKFWLASIGVYDWRGINSIPAELWLLPRWFPFHPGKMWCHARMVYLPMGYVYCKRFVPKIDSTIIALRKELYVQDYDSIHWDSTRQLCADIDVYSPLNPVLKLAQDFLSVYERIIPYLPFMMTLRKWGLDFAIDYIHAEDKQTNFVDIGPVNKALNMLAVWIDAGQDSNNECFQRHLSRVDDYLWVAEDGMKMQGYNGCQAWDTAFCTQAVIEAGLHNKHIEVVKKAYTYLQRTQIAKDEDDRDYYFRQLSKGGWPFSTSAHGWPISDCTSEGLKAVLAMHKHCPNDLSDIDVIPRERLQDAVDVILSLHNSDGGWATYENNRGHGWYEMLNPSEVFGDIMIDYSYVECTSACITALKAFSGQIADYKTGQVLNAIKAGGSFIKSIQRNDGSWYGSWGVCFLYGTWFGIEGLLASGESKDCRYIRKACNFIVSKQNPNGGWGESYVACVNKSYPYDGTGQGFGEDGSGVVQTAWALLSLMAADYHDTSVIDRGIKYLMHKQLPSGDFDQEGITGVFNRSCGITYTCYRNVFPLWALGRYSMKYEKGAHA